MRKRGKERDPNKMNTPLAVKAADGITKQSDVRNRDGEAG